jgi:hypothetical protein
MAYMPKQFATSTANGSRSNEAPHSYLIQNNDYNYKTDQFFLDLDTSSNIKFRQYFNYSLSYSLVEKNTTNGNINITKIERENYYV